MPAPPHLGCDLETAPTCGGSGRKLQQVRDIWHSSQGGSFEGQISEFSTQKDEQSGNGEIEWQFQKI
jgi:hypothetical protein